jgi:hypothetical protein
MLSQGNFRKHRMPAFSSVPLPSKAGNLLGAMAHTCNPSYSGGRDQEDHGSKPVQANSLCDPILKKNHHKKGLVEWLKV